MSETDNSKKPLRLRTDGGHLSSPRSQAAEICSPVSAGVAETAPEQTGCPKCKATMDNDAVLCIQCGFDLRTGRSQELQISEEPKGWRRFFAWNPPPLTFKNIFSLLAIIVFILFAVKGVISGFRMEKIEDEVKITGLDTVCHADTYTGFTRRGHTSYTFQYHYDVGGHRYSGSRDIDESELEDLKQVNGQVLKVKYDKNNPSHHLVNGLSPRQPVYVIYIAFILVLSLAFWWQWFYPGNEHTDGY